MLRKSAQDFASELPLYRDELREVVCDFTFEKRHPSADAAPGDGEGVGVTVP